MNLFKALNKTALLITQNIFFILPKEYKRILKEEELYFA